MLVTQTHNLNLEANETKTNEVTPSVASNSGGSGGGQQQQEDEEDDDDDDHSFFCSLPYAPSDHKWFLSKVENIDAKVLSLMLLLSLSFDFRELS